MQTGDPKTVPPSRKSAPTRSPVGIFKHLDVGRPILIASLVVVTTPRTLSPRQRAIQERDEEIKKALNQAAVGPESHAIPITLRPGQKLETLRAAFVRGIKATNAPVKIAVRGETIYLSRRTLPGRGGRQITD